MAIGKNKAVYVGEGGKNDIKLSLKAVEYKARPIPKRTNLASRYTHGVTTNQIYIDTSPCNASNPIYNALVHRCNVILICTLLNCL